MKKINAPFTDNQAQKLRAGDEVFLSGVVYAARDQAHKRLCQAMKEKRKLPFGLKGAVVYYCGPNPARKGSVIGSCGPTTSARMDEFTPLLLKAGLKGMIGKGNRSAEVIKAIKKYHALYFMAYAGCGALISRFIKKANTIAYNELGPEAIYKFEVRDFPLIVAIDSKGNNLYSKKGKRGLNDAFGCQRIG